MSKLADNIKAYRKKHNLSQSEFASKLFVTKQAVSKWETGRGYPDSSLIPKIAEVMDTSIDELMGVKRRNKVLFSFLVFLPILTVLIIVVVPLVSNKIKERKEFTAFKTNVEETVDIDLPDKGDLVSADFQNWQSQGNFLIVDQMSYIIFDDTNQVEAFVMDISTSTKWTTSLEQNMIETIPINLQSYATIGDYYLVYNVDTNTYNELPVLPGEYDFIFLIYQTDKQRLIVFDYTRRIEEGE